MTHIQSIDPTLASAERIERPFTVVKRSVMVSGQKTSVSLEDVFWNGLKEIALRHGISVSRQLAIINAQRATGNLSSAIRTFVVEHYRNRANATALIGTRRS